MSDLLYINASPRGQASCSRRVALALVERLVQTLPGFQVDTLNLFDEDIPAFNAPAAAAKYAVMGGAAPQDAAGAAWARIIAMVERLKAARRLLISSPMWNFSIPYRLKQYFDNVVQPGLTFSFSPASGYAGLVTGRPAVLVVARGGQYDGPAAAMDMQLPYLRQILGFIGFTDIRPVVVEPTLQGGPELAEEKLRQAREAIAAMAGQFD